MDLKDVTMDFVLQSHRMLLVAANRLREALDQRAAYSQVFYQVVDCLVHVYGPCDICVSRFEVDQLAWRTRSTFELSLIASFICMSDDNLQRFEIDSELDELDVFERLSAMDKRSVEYRPASAIEERLNRLRLVKTPGQSRPMQAADFATAAGRRADYDDIYKFYSKLTHPTAWAVLGSKESISWDAAVRFLLLKANGHAAECCKAIMEKTGLTGLTGFTI